MASFLSLIRQMFNESEQMTLDEIYDKLSKTLKSELDEKTLRHRIRSAIYTLKENNEVLRMKESTYKRT